MVNVSTIFVEITISIICTVISGILLYLFKKINKQNEERAQQRIKSDIAQRELMLSIAEASEIVMRKLAGEKLNGDVEEAKEDLEKKRNTVQKITRDEYFHIINNQ